MDNFIKTVSKTWLLSYMRPWKLGSLKNIIFDSFLVLFEAKISLMILCVKKQMKDEAATGHVSSKSYLYKKCFL